MYVPGHGKAVSEERRVKVSIHPLPAASVGGALKRFPLRALPLGEDV